MHQEASKFKSPLFQRDKMAFGKSLLASGLDVRNGNTVILTVPTVPRVFVRMAKIMHVKHKEYKLAWYIMLNDRKQ